MWIKCSVYFIAVARLLNYVILYQCILSLSNAILALRMFLCIWLALDKQQINKKYPTQRG